MSTPDEQHDIQRIRQATNRAQSEAADPTVSAWVSANAGTGKTHVLTRRVLRLLLAGTPPERILCLTYTKAAAAEMSTRVFRELGFWVTKSSSDLTAALTALLGRTPDAIETARARTLFASAIETPGGLKVQTIHAFCERLLQRFPLEAGVTPGFKILDDVIARQLLREAIDDTLSDATGAPEAPLGRALRMAIAYAADDGFDDVLRAALDRKDWLEYVVRTYDHDDGGEPQDPFDAVAAEYRRVFGVPRHATADSMDAERSAVLTDAVLEHAGQVLASSGKLDQALADTLTRAKRAGRDTTARIGALQEALLTEKRAPRADTRFIAKAVRQAEPGLTAALTRARDEFAHLTEQRRSLDVIEATTALLRIADAVLTRYSKLKARRAALDFEDLIKRTASLLATSDAAQWVLYKLDGGLDHVLVDESQDTSPEQWRIVQSLASEFFAGTGSREEPRTLFAVGDEKQSIYSFQGARPEEFARMGALFRAGAAAAGAAWRDIPLNLSFRTVAPILDAVDRVFADDGRTPGLNAYTTTAIRHVANRIGHSGLVEIWPTEKTAATVTAEAWASSDDEGEAPAAMRLAELVADKIKRLIEGGDVLASEARAITPGDILILVRKRQPFAQPMVAALKARNIPVAGADRLKLADQIAVQDLVSLGDFLTLPEDDLALATVLKSPLFGFNDDDLLRLAHGRRGTLWKALLDQRSEHQAYEDAAALLRDWRRRADFLPPYEFFAGLLDRDGMRARLLARLGAEAADSIDEFLNLAISFDDAAPPSLTGFLTWLRESDREVKRDMEHGRNEVRIMTVHGAKGLEAPIVFLPDTCTTRTGGNRVSLRPIAIATLPPDAPAAYAWQIKGSGNLPVLAAGRAEVADHEAEEHNRLLYVAMTRARDRLYVAGYEGRKARPAECWYDLVTTGLADVLSETLDEVGRKVLRSTSPQTAEPAQPKPQSAELLAAEPREPWAHRPAPREPQLTMPLTPSRLAPYETDEAGEPLAATAPQKTAAPSATPQRSPQEPAATPPRVLAHDNRFLRGTLTHALLEHLPCLPAERWERAATAFVAKRGHDLPLRVRHSIVAETLAVLATPELQQLYGPGSRAEVAIAAEIPRPSGRGPALKLNGQIDRLAVIGDTVHIIDYKTNRPPPAKVELVADAYLFQLAAYRLALAQLFPDKSLQAAILWTDGPRLMPVPDAQIAAFEQRLWDLDPSNLDVG